MRFTVRISCFAALEAAPLWAPASASAVTGPVPHSTGALIPGSANTTADRSNQ